jgi:hypothetical protein
VPFIERTYCNIFNQFWKGKCFFDPKFESWFFLLKNQIMIFFIEFSTTKLLNGQQVLHLTSTTHSETTSLHPSTIHWLSAFQQYQECGNGFGDLNMTTQKTNETKTNILPSSIVTLGSQILKY